MKKLLFSLSFLFLMLSSHAAIYDSNALFMAIREKDALEGIGYEAEESEGFLKLYRDGVLISEREYVEDGYIERSGDGERRITLDNYGRIIAEEENGLIWHYYYSDDGLLLTAILSNGDEILDSSAYFYDSSSNVVRIDKIGKSYIIADSSFYLGSGDDAALIRDGISVLEEDETETEENNDGTISILENDGVRRTYSSSGLLLFEESLGRYVSYSYDESGRLLEERIEEGNTSRINEYRSSRIYRSSYYVDSALRSITTYSDSIREIRYRNGEEYAELIYDRDGRTLRGINML